MKFKSLLAYLTLCTGDPLDIIYPSRWDLVNKNHTYAGLAKDPLDTKHSPPPMWNPQDKRKADIHLLCQSTWDPQIFFLINTTRMGQLDQIDRPTYVDAST